MDNITKTKTFLKAIVLFIWGLSVLTTSVAVWNAAKGEIPSGFYCVMAALNLVITGGVIGYAAKKVLTE